MCGLSNDKRREEKDHKVQLVLSGPDPGYAFGGPDPGDAFGGFFPGDAFGGPDPGNALAVSYTSSETTHKL